MYLINGPLAYRRLARLRANDPVETSDRLSVDLVIPRQPIPRRNPLHTILPGTLLNYHLILQLHIIDGFLRVQRTAQTPRTFTFGLRFYNR